MCAIGHMIHEFNPSIDLRLNKNWVDIVVDNIGVNSSEGKVVVDNLLEPVWKANDRSFGLPSVSGRALSAFAMAFRAHVEQSNEGVTLE